MDKHTFEITGAQEGDRIDKVLASFQPAWSRTVIQQWLKEQRVKVNDQLVKANYKVKIGDLISVDEPHIEELMDVSPEKMDLQIIYEDLDVLVVNKPRGMVVHPAPGHVSGTLVNGLLYHCEQLSTMNGDMRPGIVHRIDKDTSGLLMVAKNDEAHASLVEQLVDKSVTRVYTALVHGHIPHDHGTIDAPIGRDPRERKSMTVVDNGKQAVTHFKVLERFGLYTLVECRLETGRTHQIRVHMKYIGYPLAGDPKYGPKKTIDFGGQVLHAGTLGFQHPSTKEYLEFSVAPPDDFQHLLTKLRKNIDNP